MPAPDTAPVASFFEAVTRCDFAACIRSLGQEVTFKALLPDAHHDVTGSREAAWPLTHRFDDALEVEVLDQVVDTIVDHMRIRYRLRLKYEDGWHIREQQATALRPTGTSRTWSSWAAASCSRRAERAAGCALTPART